MSDPTTRHIDERGEPLRGKELYRARKDALECVTCETALIGSETDHVRCDECRERNKASSLRYARENKERQVANAMAWQRANPEKHAQTQKESKIRRYDRGVCRNCVAPRVGESEFCDECRVHHKAVSLAYYHRVGAERRRTKGKAA